MADKVGSMEVEYSVIVGEAIKNLERYNKMIEKNNKQQQKAAKKEKEVSAKRQFAEKIFGKARVAQALKIKKSFAIAAIAITAVVGLIYSIIKASSYGKVYMEQFGATTQQLANIIMEETGLNTALEDALRAYQKFVDKLAEDPVIAILDLIIDFVTWLGVNFLTPVVDAGRAFQKFLDNIGEVGVWEAIKILIYDFGVWIWDQLGMVFPNVTRAIEIFWDTLTGNDWIQLGKDTLGKFVDWVKTNVIDAAYYWGLDMLAYIWDGIDSLLEIVGALLPDEIKEKILEIIDKCYKWGVDIATKIKDGIMSIPIIIKIKTEIEKLWGGGGSSGGDPTGGGEWSSSRVGDAIIAPGGKIITTNPADYLIATKTPGDLGGKGGNTYNIAPVINISSTGSNNDISRQVSKAIADEIKRMTKI